MTGLALRQAVRNLSNDEAVKKGLPLWNDLPVRLLAQDDKSPVFLANIDKSDLDELAKINYTASYQDISILGSAVAHILDAKAPVADGISEYQMELAGEIAKALKNAKNPLIISGISSRNKGIVNSAINISKALAGTGSKVMLSMILPECNSMGLGLFAGKSFDELLISTDKEEIDTLIILENDLYQRFEEQKVDSLFKRSRRVIVLAHTQYRCCHFCRIDRYNC
jgi:NADH-quinone oxidoreductase subunit G